MNCFSEEQLSRISHLVREIEKLTDVEKLFLYLQLPCGRADATDANSNSGSNNSSNNSKQRFNGATAGGIQKSLDLFSKKPDQETTQTYTWILSHLEIDPNVSLPKQEVYDEYRAFCQANRFEPLCVADFGKAMKHAFPCIKPRRLGQRGNSRYCYSGLRKRYKIQPPNLPDLANEEEQNQQQQLMYCTLTSCHEQQTASTSTSSASHQLNTSSAATSSNININNNSNSNNSSNFNGNNMTVKNGTSISAECPLLNNKRPNYNSRPEVMNLKIEPNQQHPNQNQGSGVIQFTDDPTKQQVGGYSFQLEDIGRAHHHQQPSQLAQQHQQQQLIPSNHHLQQQHHHHSTTSSSASSYDGHALGHHLPHHSRYTDYSSRTIQQPGTPDDDDYRHNYQDMLPLSGHFLGSSSQVLTTLPQAHSNQPAPAQGPISLASGSANNFSAGYQQQQAFGPATMAGASCVANSPTTADGHTPMMQSNDGKYISTILQSQPPFSGGGRPTNVPIPASSSGNQIQPVPSAQHQRPAAQAAGPPPGTSIHLLNHQMSVTHMDACASPFQSPASTPYPTMSSNYPIQDMMMQEYCSSGCRLYQST